MTELDSPPKAGPTVVPSRGDRDSSLPRVLLVDDEPDLLAGMVRRLRDHFDCTVAPGGAEGINELRTNGPFDVVVSDMQMPGTNGLAVLNYADTNAPDTVRVLLTGYADLDSAIEAVNEGNIFRFLNKPMAGDLMRKVLTDCVGQRRMLMAQSDLLESTLKDTVKALLDTLSMANPVVFARAMRLRNIMSELLDHMDSADRSSLEIAANLSQIGAVTLPPQITEKLHTGSPLDETETEMVEQLPVVTDQLLAGVPQLAEMRKIIREQHRWTAHDAPLGTKLLRLAADIDALESSGRDFDSVVAELSERFKDYGPKATAAFLALHKTRALTRKVMTVDVTALESNMVLAVDIRAKGGSLLVARGTSLSEGQLERLRNCSKVSGLDSPSTTVTVSS